ncbi:MAG: gamma carbonic anhydrase family protein [Pseudomonadota bacterium]
MSDTPRMRTGRGFGPRVEIAEGAVVHDTALIHGRVRLGPRVSVWPYAVMRAEMHEIAIGEGSNIQDFAMIHVGYDTPTLIGTNCSITHHCTIHGAEIGDDCLIGINATVMDGAKIGAGSIVAGHAIVTEGSEFPENSVIAGTPARLIRERDNRAANRANADWYWRNAQAYARGLHRMEDW